MARGKRYLIQTTAPISRGSSGGGLFDARGKLVGITTFFLSEGQNLNFALPAECVQALLHGKGDFSESSSTAAEPEATETRDHTIEELRVAGQELERAGDYKLAAEVYEEVGSPFPWRPSGPHRPGTNAQQEEHYPWQGDYRI